MSSALVHRAFLFRVWERHGREIRVRVGLLRHREHIRKARARERIERESIADAVHGRVHDAKVSPRLRAEAKREDRIVVRREHRIVDVEDEPLGTGLAEILPRNVFCWRCPLDGARNVRVDRRNDLRGVLPVDFVPVILGRIVARGHHDPSCSAEVFHGKRRDRRRCDIAKQVGTDALRGEHAGCVLGKRTAQPAPVEADDDAALLCVLHRQEQHVAEPARGTKHDSTIHS
jgi:hypothetical protein